MNSVKNARLCWICENSQTHLSYTDPYRTEGPGTHHAGRKDTLKTKHVTFCSKHKPFSQSQRRGATEGAAMLTRVLYEPIKQYEQAWKFSKALNLPEQTDVCKITVIDQLLKQAIT